MRPWVVPLSAMKPWCSVLCSLGPGLLSPMVSPLKGLGPPPLPPSSQSQSPGGQSFSAHPSKPTYPAFQSPPPPLPSPQGKLLSTPCDQEDYRGVWGRQVGTLNNRLGFWP